MNGYVACRFCRTHTRERATIDGLLHAVCSCCVSKPGAVHVGISPPAPVEHGLVFIGKMASGGSAGDFVYRKRNGELGRIGCFDGQVWIIAPLKSDVRFGDGIAIDTVDGMARAVHEGETFIRMMDAASAEEIKAFVDSPAFRAKRKADAATESVVDARAVVSRIAAQRLERYRNLPVPQPEDERFGWISVMHPTDALHSMLADVNVDHSSFAAVRSAAEEHERKRVDDLAEHWQSAIRITDVGTEPVTPKMTRLERVAAGLEKDPYKQPRPGVTFAAAAEFPPTNEALTEHHRWLDSRNNDVFAPDACGDDVAAEASANERAAEFRRRVALVARGQR